MAAYSKTAICNIALQHIGGGRVLDVTTDKGAEATAFNDVYDVARPALIRLHKWNCFTARASLPQDATAPAWGYSYRYQVPSACLRVFEVCGIPQDMWRREGSYILTDTGGGINVLYVFDSTDTGSYDPLFAQALAALVAVYMASKLPKKTSIINYCQNRFDYFLAKAVQADAQESAIEFKDETDWYQW